MPANYRWKKGFFSNTCRLYCNEQPIGKFTDRLLSKSADAEINGERYKFKTKGVLKPETVILNINKGTAVGKITYNFWMTKAKLSIGEETIYWEYDNIWSTKWSVHNPDGMEASYKGSPKKGKAASANNGHLTVLSGLFVAAYYKKMTSITVFTSIASLFTILISVIG